MKLTRREFMHQTSACVGYALGAAAFVSGVQRFALINAFAQGVDYRALVCVFLYGGNDAYNMVLATDADSWTHYTAARDQAPDSIALATVGVPGNTAAAAGVPARLGGVLPLDPGVNAQNPGRSFALHPLLGGVRTLFAARRLVIVPNAVAICMGAAGLLTPGMAAAINNGSTILAALAGLEPLLRTGKTR